MQGLTAAPEKASELVEPEPGEVVFEGTPDEINRFFYENGWSDGLPIVPPTRRARRGVPAPHRPRCRRAAGRAAAGPPQRHHPDDRDQRGDGGLPARVHAGAGGADRGHGRSALRRRAQRQHAGRGDAHHPQRADHPAARLQLSAGRAARRLPGQHEHRPLLAALSAQRRRLPAAQDRQGDVRQHVARGAGGERGRDRQDGLDDDRPGSGAEGGRQRRDDLALHRRHRAGLRLRHAAGADDPVPGRRHRADRRVGSDLRGRHVRRRPAATAGAEPDPGPDAGARRAQQAGRPAPALPARAHSGAAVRALHRRVDEPAAGSAVPARPGEARPRGGRSSRSPTIPIAWCRSSRRPRTS